MVKNRNFYEILGINENASLMEVKNHYHKLARLYHPDITKLKNTHDRFIEINEAYRTLKDPILRKAYDFGLKQSRNKKDGSDSGFRTGAAQESKSAGGVDMEQAQKAYKAKTTDDLAKLASLTQKAKVAFANNGFTEALNCIDKALELDDQLFDMWKIRGDIYFQQQNYDLSMESYSKACKINDTPEIRSLLSQVITLRVKQMNKKSVVNKKKGGFFKKY